MRRKTSVNQEIRTFVDYVTGEVIQQEETRKIKSSEPDFIKLYLDDIMYLSDMPKKHSKILMKLLNYATYADKKGMRLYLNAELKKDIAEELGYKSVQVLNNAIADLNKGKVLIRTGAGTYNLNPYFFGKGDWKDISKLRLEINYDEIQGKTFKAVCEYNTGGDNNDETETGTDRLHAVS